MRSSAYVTIKFLYNSLYCAIATICKAAVVQPWSVLWHPVNGAATWWETCNTCWPGYKTGGMSAMKRTPIIRSSNVNTARLAVCLSTCLQSIQAVVLWRSKHALPGAARRLATRRLEINHQYNGNCAAAECDAVAVIAFHCTDLLLVPFQFDITSGPHTCEQGICWNLFNTFWCSVKVFICTRNARFLYILYS